MDDWKYFFFKYFKIPSRLIDSLDVSDRQLLRNQLQCNSFEWYLQNVWPDNFFPSSNRFLGKILLIREDSELFKSYMDIISEADAKPSNWTYITNFLNSKLPHFQKLLMKMPMYCLKQPQNRNSLSTLPYGMASIGECIDKAFMDEMFVVRENGQVSFSMARRYLHEPNHNWMCWRNMYF